MGMIRFKCAQCPEVLEGPVDKDFMMCDKCFRWNRIPPVPMIVSTRIAREGYKALIGKPYRGKKPFLTAADLILLREMRIKL